MNALKQDWFDPDTFIGQHQRDADMTVEAKCCRNLQVSTIRCLLDQQIITAPLHLERRVHLHEKLHGLGLCPVGLVG